jgi:hypothetical protein
MAKKSTVLANVSNDAAHILAFEEPYTAVVGIEGTAPLLYHAWSIEAVAEKAAAKKGSKAKKTDNVESYLHRVSDTDRRIGIPGNAFHSTLAVAAKYMQDPRSPRKSAMDLVKAGIIVTTFVAPLIPDTTEPDYIDRRRVVIQRSAITRERPAMQAGWRAEFELTIGTPEYIDRLFLQQLIGNAGRLVGLLDFRPTFGRFSVVKFEIR